MTNIIPNQTPMRPKCIYQCTECNFNTRNKKDYNKHLLTAKHMRLINPINKTPKYPTCGCGKEYKHMSSLCKHKKHVPILPTKYLMIKSIRYQIQ